MNRICFVSVYFGNIPKSMNLFFQSCKWNEKFDWLFVYDKEANFDSVPQNVRLYKMNQEEFRVRLCKVSGLDIPQFKPYKICDFRPAFGEIFHKELMGYEFWGICDTDLILGNLSHFITDDILKNYDKIYTVGHLSIVKNTNYINTLYKKSTKNSRDYKKIFLNPSSCIFDEYEGFTEKFEDSGLKVYKFKECADIYFDKEHIKINTKGRTKLIQYRNNYLNFCEKKNFFCQLFTINEGKIIKYYLDGKCLKEKEYSYIHKLEYSYPYSLQENSKYLITFNRLIEDDNFFNSTIDGNISKSYFTKYNKTKIAGEIFRNIQFFLRMKIRKYRKIFFPRKNEI